MNDLPKHNGLLRGLYLVSVLFMFVFMMGIIRAYWPDEVSTSSITLQPPEAVETTTHQSFASTLAHTLASEDVTEASENGRAHDRVFRAKKTIVGLSKAVDLSGDVGAQMKQLWRDFYNAEGVSEIEGIKNKRKIYVAYLAYHDDRHSADVLIGYSVDHRRFDTTTSFAVGHIPGGEYLSRHAVFDEWQKTPNPAQPLAYQYDYEVYDLGREFSIINQTAFVRIAQ